jgi:hypothetical protein
VNKAAASDTEQVAHLSNSILKDFALTNKLLKLVNSAHFGQYRGSISTISRAVIIIGFDNIRNVAVTLMLLEHLQNKAQAAQVIKRGSTIPLASQPDVFHAAPHRGSDIHIEDVDAEQIRAHIPGWYRKAMPARSLVLFPVLVSKRPVALFYADADQPAAVRLAAT